MAKRTFMKVGQWLWAAALVVVVVAQSSANNFNKAADKNGCDSLVGESELRACKTVQGEKNTLCNVESDCNVDKQERQIEKYKAAQKRLDEGSLAEADKDNFRKTIRDLKDDLDARKATSVKGQEIATRCIKARDAVQKWFEDVAIPFTERSRDSAMRERKDLLSKLEDTQKKVREAKEKRDAKPEDSSLRSDYERAVDAMRSVEKELETLNAKYGPEIEYNANKLISHYKSEKTNHDRPSKQADERLANCKKLEGLSY